MIVYHGSSEVIRTPQYGKGPHHGDYGPGFYCTESLKMARGWACPTKAAEVFDGMMASGETNLARARRIKGPSRSQLAGSSGVSIRSIQIYEQRRTDIGRIQYNHLKALSLTLGCSVEDIPD